MKLPRVKSVPIIHSIFSEGVEHFKKSASSQLLSEMTQLGVEDFKQTNSLFSELGSNANEFAQSGVECVEEEALNKPTKIFVRFFIRFMVGNVVHFIHHLFLMFCDFITAHYHIFVNVK